MQAEVTENAVGGQSMRKRQIIGPVSTMKISRDQPHEGNMFEFFYKRHSIERAW
jgi:hypothetical protein